MSTHEVPHPDGFLFWNPVLELESLTLKLATHESGRWQQCTSGASVSLFHEFLKKIERLGARLEIVSTMYRSFGGEHLDINERYQKLSPDVVFKILRPS